MLLDAFFIHFPPFLNNRLQLNALVVGEGAVMRAKTRLLSGAEMG